MASIMLDLETLSTKQNSVVLTLGAVKFNAFSLQEPHEELYLRIDADEQIAMGRDVSESTVEWWMKQSPEVQEEAMGSEGRVSVVEACRQLNKFLVGVDKIWCQGPHFDITILETLFADAKLNTNWQYYQVMDSRTVFSLFGDLRDKTRASAHNAVEDCKEQVRALQKLNRQLGITKYADRF